MRVQRTNGSSNTGVPQIAQNLETTTSIPLQGKQVTVSFYARAGANYSASSNILNWRIYGGTGTDQNIFSYTGQAIVVDQSVTLTTSWQRFTYTTTALTSYNEYGLFFFTVPTGTAGAADYFDVTGVQLEQNYQPTPFEQRPIGIELALCQRYYWKSYEYSIAPGTSSNSGFFYATISTDSIGRAFYVIPYPTPIRTTSPTFTFYRNSGASGSWDVYWNGGNAAPLPTSYSTGTERGTLIISGAGAPAWGVVTVYGHLTVSAEL
jgi:hypothetical protein